MAPISQVRKSFQNYHNHKYVWDSIFKDYHFLKTMQDAGFYPLLLGADLLRYYEEGTKILTQKEENQETEVHLVLLCGEGWRGQQAESLDNKKFDRCLLERSLREYDDGPPTSQEVIIRGRIHITLHIDNYCMVRDSGYGITCSSPRLYGIQNGSYYSCYLYWKGDQKRLGQLGPSNILGLREEDSPAPHPSSATLWRPMAAISGIVLPQAKKSKKETPRNLIIANRGWMSSAMGLAPKMVSTATLPPLTDTYGRKINFEWAYCWK